MCIRDRQGDEILQASAESIGYIHLATKNLQALQDNPNPQNTKVLNVLPEGQPVSIEMLAGDKSNNLIQVQGALDWVEKELLSVQQEMGE